jgi:hypothetical protein
MGTNADNEQKGKPAVPDKYPPTPPLSDGVLALHRLSPTPNTHNPLCAPAAGGTNWSFGDMMAASNAQPDDGLYSQNSQSQKSPSPQAQHRRGYQACDPCRKRKVKCDLGSKAIPLRDHTIAS